MGTISKRCVLIFFCLFTSDFLLFAQAPQAIPYQAIARNASGTAIASTAVKVRFSIRDSIATGPVRYQETHTPTTSALGLFSVNVGAGTVVSGSFAGINWGKNAKFLQVELDPSGGNTFTNLGTTQMMSVPYALNAGNGLANGTANNQIMYWNGTAWTRLNPGSNGQTLTICNGVLTWTNGGVCPSSVVTDVDGNTYQTVTIGSQVWMKENLKVSKYRNGNAIPTGLTDAAWSATTSGAFAIYDNLAANNTTYGKLYNWYAVADPRGLCPAGWHVPTEHDWQLLTKFLDLSADTTIVNGASSFSAGGIIKAISSLWTSPNIGSTNSSGFSAMPGGFYEYFGFSFNDIGIGAYFWTSTGISTTVATSRVLNYSTASLFQNQPDKNHGYSVRCLKD